jgi:hypothetical protein
MTYPVRRAAARPPLHADFSHRVWAGADRLSLVSREPE